MNRIRLLPEQVANQIAAGEVVERPASVVKELVENAVDAKATRVVVDVQAGGRSLIRVTDDGWGMSRDDALLCLERHATSKIRRAEDLAAIATMGFRGEALPSIASVSRFTLTTRERDGDALEATQVNIAGGKILEVLSAGGPPGTRIEVRQLFYNLPARRKFLRSEETERTHIQHYLLLAALAHPEVGFTFTHDNRLVWQLPPLPCSPEPASRLAALRERLRALHGAELNLLPVDFSASLKPSPAALAPDEEPSTGAEFNDRPGSDPGMPEPPPAAPEFHVWGFIGAPGVSRATRDDQHLFVNRRPVENRGLNFALLEGYHTALMKGRYPVCCLFFELSPGEVDVNIHPAKREVKFHSERQVRALTTQAVREVLLGYHARSGVPQAAAPPASATPATELGGQRLEKPGPMPGSIAPPTQAHIDLGPGVLGPIFVTQSPPTTLTPVERATSESLPGNAAGVADEAPTHETQLAAKLEANPAPVPGEKSPARTVSPGQPSGAAVRSAGAAGGAQLPLLSVPLRLVGVIGRLYVVLESDRGLVLLDQHAAHERILFEQMLAQLEQGDAPSQRLLLAETVEVSARDAEFLRTLLPTLTRLGVGLSEFGERTFLLDSLPPVVRAGDPRDFVLTLLDQLKAAGQEVNSMRPGEDVVAKTVCRHAVKANDFLEGPELERLVEDLRRCAMPYTCPHGRPTLIELNYRELEKKFGRIQ